MKWRRKRSLKKNFVDSEKSNVSSFINPEVDAISERLLAYDTAKWDQFVRFRSETELQFSKRVTSHFVTNPPLSCVVSKERTEESIDSGRYCVPVQQHKTTGFCDKPRYHPSRKFHSAIFSKQRIGSISTPKFFPSNGGSVQAGYRLRTWKVQTFDSCIRLSRWL